MSVHGGARTGAGRRKGSVSLEKRAVKDIIDSVVDMEDVIERIVQLSEGVMVEKTNEEGDKIIYQEKPDTHAAKILLEYRYGKPSQSVDVTTLGKPINSITIDIIENKGEQTTKPQP